jgi:poly(hydroxyalkanoate) depolymerase family esterase
MKPRSNIFAQMQSAIRTSLSTVLTRLRGSRHARSAAPADSPAPDTALKPDKITVQPATPDGAPDAATHAADAKHANHTMHAKPMPAHQARPAKRREFAQKFMSHIGTPDVLETPKQRRAATPPPKPAAHEGTQFGGQFLSRSYTNAAGTREYKLYIPGSITSKSMPLLVMLHGCTQNPDDFAAGTQMNALAEEKQCMVAYPAQAKSVNPSRCWNWFNALDQKRDQGEPSIIAGIALQISAEYPINPGQIYVAGLSAGGAMAVIVGTLYPEVFTAVGVHSGLPFAAARDLPSALLAMRSGVSVNRNRRDGGIPIIVFHGDRDTTVHPRNGDELMAQGLRNQAGDREVQAAAVREGSVPNGHRYTQTTHNLNDGSPLAEHWVVHGAGHAWSGGSEDGSYTDAKGPDASREMMRFFETVN